MWRSAIAHYATCLHAQGVRRGGKCCTYGSAWPSPFTFVYPLNLTRIYKELNSLVRGVRSALRRGIILPHKRRGPAVTGRLLRPAARVSDAERLAFPKNFHACRLRSADQTDRLWTGVGTQLTIDRRL